MMINWFERFLLRQLLRYPCPDHIPGCGSERKGIKCYRVYLKNSADECLLYVQEVSGKGFYGTRWNDQESKSYSAFVPFSCIGDLSIEIQRFINHWEFTYQSILKCVLYDWTCFDRISVVIDYTDQFFFNRRDLALQERTKVLKVLFERYRKEPAANFDEINLVELLHGQRWINHPDRVRQQAHARLLLNSLRDSGELQAIDNMSYKLTGKALVTLETYEREEKRHNQTKNLTRALVIVGIIQAVAGLVQAYIAYLKP